MDIPTPVPDSHGLNLYRADPTLARLIRLYVLPDLATHLHPHLDRLGALAGGRLDALAATADKNPPVLHHRTRAGADRQSIEKHPAFVEMERLAFGEYGIAALSHHPGVLGWPARLPPIAKYLIVFLFSQAEFGLMCPVSMTDSLTRSFTMRHMRGGGHVAAFQGDGVISGCRANRTGGGFCRELWEQATFGGTGLEVEMDVVQVELPDDLKNVIDRQVAEGRVASESEFLVEAARRFAAELDAEAEILDIARRGIADIESGRFVTISSPEDAEAVSQQIMADVRARLGGGAT
ncbi:MAG TPA: hypothetical protein VGG99_07480 [Acetobacteraceae bacterium]|jgi:Arc/MetJ-type ribon-helix-helix transcriptional regulator